MASGVIELRNALIVPPELDERGKYNKRSGVYAENGDFIRSSLSISSGDFLHRKPQDNGSGRSNESYLNGNHAFGGVFFGHFGHFIAESTGRLWILGEPDIALDSVIYAPKEDSFGRKDIERQTALLAAIGINTRLEVVVGPTRVERLYIPRQEFGLDRHLIRGTPRYVDFMRKAASNVKPEGAERLYISREGLPPDRGTILGEKFITKWLEKEGYRIFKPQNIARRSKPLNIKQQNKLFL